MDSSRVLLALGALSLLLLLEVVRLRGARALAALRSRARGRRALRGERDAEALVRRLGYRVLARQAEGEWAPTLDGVRVPVRLRADLLVQRGGRRYVAEVKTGEVAPQLGSAATRRQLLEYRLAFDVDGVLLVAPERSAVHAVEFPGVESPAARRLSSRAASTFLRGLALGALLALLVERLTTL